MIHMFSFFVDDSHSFHLTLPLTSILASSAPSTRSAWRRQFQIRSSERYVGGALARLSVREPLRIRTSSDIWIRIPT